MQLFHVDGRVGKDKRAALGRVCIYWANLEQRIDQVIWALKGIDRKAGRKITANWASANKRIEVMRAEANKKFPNQFDQKDMNKIADELLEMALERNWAVHGLWGNGTERGMRRRTYAVSHFKKPYGQYKEMTVDYLETLSKKMAAITMVLGMYIEKKIGQPIP